MSSEPFCVVPVTVTPPVVVGRLSATVPIGVEYATAPSVTRFFAMTALPVFCPSLSLGKIRTFPPTSDTITVPLSSSAHPIGPDVLNGKPVAKVVN